MRKNGNNELNRGTKKTFISILPILGAGLLAAGALVGAGLSVWQVSKNYKASGEFSNSTVARVKIDPVAYEIEGSKKDESIAKANAKLAAERLSEWLRSNGQDSYDVSYEMEAPGEGGTQYYAYLTAQFKLSKVTSKHSADTEKIDNDPYLSIFENKGFNTNNKSFVYRWYDVNNKEHPDEAQPKYTILNFSDLFVLPEKVGETGAVSKPMADKNSKNGIVYKVNEKNADFLNKVYLDLAKYNADTKDKSSNKDINAKVQPRIYIINNLEGMFNEASYHLSNWGYSVDQEARFSEYDKIYKDSDYSKFAKEYYLNTWKGQQRSFTAKKLQSVDLTTDGKTTSGILKNGDLLNWIDTKTPGTVEHSIIFSKYVEDVIPYGKITEYFKENIDDDKIKNTLSEKEEECKITYWWHPYNNQSAAESYFNTMIEKSWRKSKIVSIDLDSTTDWKVNYDQFTGQYKTTIVAPKFTETIFHGDKLVATLSIGFLIYLVILGILLACLYRMTGVFSWICMMFMLSITGLIAAFGSASVVSLSLLFGMFIMSIVGFVTAIAFCGKMKRRLLSNEDTQVIVAKTFKQSLWPTVDVSIIALIFGICFTYIAPLGLNPLGLVLIVGAFANVIITYLLNGLLHALLFNNKITIHHYGLFGRGHSNVANEVLSQGRNDVPVSLDASKLNFNYYSKLCTKKLNVTNKKTIVALIVTGVLLIAAIVVFLVLGFVNTKMFHADNCIVVTLANKDFNIFDLMSKAGQSYTSYTASKDGLVYYFYCTGLVDNITSKLSVAGVSSVWTQTVIGSTNRDILTSALLAIIVAGVISTVYIGIRNNWTAFVPMLASAMGLPLIILGIASISQIKFDETVVLAYSLTTVVNSVFTVAIINSINSVWSRHDGYNKAELRFIVNESLKNDFFIYILVAISYALFILLFGLTAPAGCGQITLLLIIAFIVTMFFVPFVTAALLYWFLVIRNKALTHRAKRKANKVVVNYDEIDEQSIEDINKFSKKIAIPKEEPVTHEQK